MQLAPIIIFTYRRIATLEVLVRSLLNNPEAADSEVYFFCDGSKGAEDAADVEEVQNFVKQLTGFGKIHIHFSEVNKGLAASVISGVSAVSILHNIINKLLIEILVCFCFMFCYLFVLCCFGVVFLCSSWLNVANRFFLILPFA